jgi:hypothetical protein
MSQQGQGITDNQLFQQFTKSIQVCTNSFQLLFDTTNKIQLENDLMLKLLKANNIKMPTEPLPEGTMIQKMPTPNRAERRRAEKIQKKEAKKAK